ncbi:transglutaminase-like domain-containing protein [uncultured Aquimarina sp.]|uniref:transglutaminase-like domain-containing protein n=1 Tax=uncultured Aquimarina sp. TaxID=575652 RepID=UPI0026347165|nr:transglutaminase-like domain-containing protein [uncultured Aquimarina sp.]
MDNIVDYSVLYRPLKSGRDYDGLLPKTFCKATRLSSGNTETTVKHMRSWVETYYRQTVKLSTKLKGRTLAQTISSIYGFLYHHIQYKADATDQLLRSPACAWVQRKEGIDCKSYSIFASCILTNLSIPHYIRKVKQPNHFPQEYTHVYIIVPINGKDLTEGYYVIDATKHENTEVEFIKSKDVFMSGLPHIGLNGVAVNGSVKNPLQLSKLAFEGLENYLFLLSEVNVPRGIINGIRSEVKKYINLGVNPAFKIYRKGVIINRKRFLFENNTGLNRPGSSLKSAKSVIAQLSGNASGLGNPDTATSDPNQNGDQELEEVTAQILDSNWFGDTFGAIFANGFNFSCWGSSYSPSKAKKNVEVDMPFIVAYSGLEKAITAFNLAKFLNLARGYQADAIGGQNSRFAKCTRQGHSIRQQAIEAVIENVMDSIKSLYTLKSFGKVEGNVQIPNGLPGYAAGRSYQWGTQHGTERYEYTSYSLKKKENTSGGDGVIITDSGGGGGSTDNGGSGSGGGNNPDILNPVNPTDPSNPTNPNTPTSGGMSTTAKVGIGIGATAIVGLLFKKQIISAFTKK